MIPRSLTGQIIDSLEVTEPKVVLLFGPRRVGKTTLLRDVARTIGGKQLFLNADFVDDAALLRPERATLDRVSRGFDALFIDEAQQVPEIGRVLKLLHDTYPRLRVVASGSASFDLRERTGEPLTGRQQVFDLFPLSLVESEPNVTTVQATMEHGMVFGSYPEVFLTPNPTDKAELLRNLAAEYLLKDILAVTGIDRTRVLELLRLLAFQIGSEVSYGELSRSARLDIKTVIRYIDLLEHAFVIFRLSAFSRNLRKEIRKSRKVYFVDLGIRNALLNRFDPPALRDDVGGLWENYLVVERRKRNRYLRSPAEGWFWRTYDQQEIDYVEQEGDTLAAYEFRWTSRGPVRAPVAWRDAYPEAAFHRIGRDDARHFLDY
ncbi:MAG: ATP-binding protein [Spirochaetota bacterium]